jgi:hypothetical protein
MRSKVDMTVTIKDVTEEGDIDMHWEMGEPEISFSGGVFPFTQSDMMNMITELATQQMSGREAKMFRKEMEKAMQGQNEFDFLISDRGKLKGLDFPMDAQGMSKKESKMVMEIIGKALQTLPSVYPEDPVRRGDSWTVTYNLPEMLSGIADDPQVAMIGGMLNLPVIAIDFKVDGFEMFEGRECLKVRFESEGGWDLGALMGMASAGLASAPLEISGRSFHVRGLDFDLAWGSRGYFLYDYRDQGSIKSFSDTTMILEANGTLKEAGGDGLVWPVKVRLEQNSLEQAIVN